MKISQITYTGFGGLGSVVFSLISAEPSHRHDWSIGFIGDLPLEATYQVLCDEHKVEYAAFRSTPGKPYGSWLALARWLEAVNPDVVICHSINSILACRWYASRQGARLIAVEHTSNQVKTRSEWAASRVSMLVADRVVVLTDEYRDELRKAHGWLYRSNKVSVIPNGIDITLFCPSSATLPKFGTPIRLGMAARFSFSKRQDLLVDVILRLAEIRPDLSFELHFAGDGDELERVKALAHSSPLTSRIYFDGLLNERQLADWFRGLDVYVHATDGETLSTSLLQAMATGLPIVASSIPGVVNLLGTAGEYGLCATNTMDFFCAAILQIVDSELMRNRIRARARQKILEDYGNNKMLERYSNLFV